MKLKKNYLIAIICKIIVIFSTFLISIFINRGLGVKLKGEYSYIINLVEILYILGGLGLGQSYATFKSREGKNIRNVFVSLSLLHGILTLILGIILLPILNIKYGLIIVILTALAVVRANLSIIAVIENSILRNIISTSVNVFYLVLLIFFYLTKKCNLYTVLICYGLNEILRSVIFLKKFKMFPYKEKASIYKIKQIYKTGIITMVVTLLISINYSIDTIMLKGLTNSYNVGLYSVAVTFSNMFLLIPDAFKEVMFGDSTKKNFESQTAFTAIKVSLLASVLILICFIFFGNFAISILYGKEYQSSFLLTIILFSGSLSMILFKILHPIYIAKGLQNRAVLFLSLSAVINIIMNIILIPIIGRYGAAISSAVSNTVCGLSFYLDYKRIERRID